MGRGGGFESTIAFGDRLGDTRGPTVQDEEMLIRRLPRPTSAVACMVPTRLRVGGLTPSVILRRLDVSGAVFYVEHAVPDCAQAVVSLFLPRQGMVDIPGRLVQSFRRDRHALWVVEMKFILRDPEVRSGLAGLIEALKLRRRQQGYALQ